MPRILSDESLDTLFRNASPQPVWLDRPVGDTLLRALWELVRAGPAGDKSSSAQILFLRSDATKERLAPALPAEEPAGLRAAPVFAIIAADDGGAVDGAETRALAACDGALRGAYLTLAARALGLDCRPIWDFHAATIEAAFFPEGTGAVTFLCALGYGDEARSEPPQPRRDPAEACRIL
jgi:3-hydroxypropanoate dehydrogenase